MSVIETPSALAFSRSMSSLNCGASSTPLGRTLDEQRILRRHAQQLIARRQERVMRSRPPRFCSMHVEAGGVAQLEHRGRRRRR